MATPTVDTIDFFFNQTFFQMFPVTVLTWNFKMSHYNFL